MVITTTTTHKNQPEIANISNLQQQSQHNYDDLTKNATSAIVSLDHKIEAAAAGLTSYFVNLLKNQSKDGCKII
jgi:hypothetical protein